MYSHWPELMRRSQRGDATAYKRLLREISPVLRKFIIRRLFNKEQVEDLLQDILVAVHTARHTYRIEQPFERWLFGIARHKLIDALRVHYKEGLNEFFDISNETFLHLTANNKDEAFVYDMRRALKQVSERQRKIITMSKLEGHSLSEIADAMGMTEAAVKVTIHRAYKTLKFWLLENGYE